MTNTTGRKRSAVLALALATALVAPARAQESDDAETRFHRAYEAEVVDGKLADAARVYLALVADGKAPPRIRAEAKFRFAVTTVLLGRSDEARAHLDELVRDPATPEGLRARAKASLEAIAGVGLGTELERKLQSLVFDLGRLTGQEPDPPPVYRDFEILGKQAVPMLRQLLAHTDASLRAHAYRLLVRLDEPGMGRLWKAEAVGSRGRWKDIAEYLGRRPDERAALEQAVLALDDEKLTQVVSYGTWAPSAAFLREVAARMPGSEGPGIFARRALKDPEVARLCREWIVVGDPALARGAAPGVLGSFQSADAPVPRPEEAAALVAGVARAYDGADQGWAFTPVPGQPGPTADAARASFLVLARACPVPALLDAMERALQSLPPPKDSQIRFPSDPMPRALRDGVIHLLALAVEERAPTGDDLVRHGRAVVAWGHALKARGWIDNLGHTYCARLAWVLRTLPQAEGEQAAGTLFAGADEVAWLTWVSALPDETAAHFAVAMAAFRAADPRLRYRIAHRAVLGADPQRVPSDAAKARAVVAAYPELVRAAVASDFSTWNAVLAEFPGHASLLPVEEARAALVGTARQLMEIENLSARKWVLSGVLHGRGGAVRRTWWEAAVLPEAEDLRGILDFQSRTDLVYGAVLLLTEPGDVPDRERLADFVAAHADEIPVNDLVVRLPAALPPERWVARASPEVIVKAFESPTDAQRDAVESVLAKVAPSPADFNASVRAYVRACGRPEEQQRFLDRLLREAPLDIVAAAQGDPGRGKSARGVVSASPEAVVDAAVRMASAPGPLPPYALHWIVNLAVQTAPSERLFPAVRRLLASSDKAEVLGGISAAERLGRAELLDDLSGKLESMDADVREAARKAIDSIVELRKLRDEARRRAAESGR